METHFPALFNLVNYLYTTFGYLSVGQGEGCILSTSGMQQGCPLAPFLFSLTLKEVTDAIQKGVPGLSLNKWYLDDGHLVGHPVDLLRCIDIISRMGQSLGMELNLSKCIVFGSTSSTSHLPTDLIRAAEGINVLGSPVGTDLYMANQTDKIVSKAGAVMFESKFLEDPQMELLILRYCTGAHKMTHWLRTCPSHAIQGQIEAFDNLVDDSLQHIIGHPIFHQDRTLAHLPLSQGGLGISRALLLADPAFIASVGASWVFQPATVPRNGYAEATERLHDIIDIPELPEKFVNTVSASYTQAKQFSQHKFMAAINGNLRSIIMQSADPRKQALIHGRSCKGANFWLTVPPNVFNRTPFDPAAFRSLLNYYLGVPIISEERPCPDCGKILDIYGHHALSCRTAAGSIERHNGITLSLAQILKKANINYIYEARNPMKDNRQRPGDILFHNFDVYGDAYLDVSVINICAKSYVKTAATGPLEGSRIRFEAKKNKYPELGARFKPLIVETSDGWHPFSMDYL